VETKGEIWSETLPLFLNSYFFMIFDNLHPELETPCMHFSLIYDVVLPVGNSGLFFFGCLVFVFFQSKLKCFPMMIKTANLPT